MPSLRYVDFTSVPWGYVFNRPSPLFTGLVTLSLAAGQSAVCSLSKLRDLLSASPQLQSLSLCTGDEGEGDFETTTERVQLASLGSLSVCTTIYVDWIPCVIQMIDAPALKKLTLVSFVAIGDENMRILQPATATNLPTNGAVSNSSHRSRTMPYPLLNELDVSRLNCKDNQLVDMLVSLPSITKLSIYSHQIVLLGEQPWVLPRLNHLKLPQGTSSYSSLGDILHRREQGGFPIKVLELGNPEDAFRDESPGTVKLIAYTGASFEEDHDDSDYDF